MYYLIKYIMTYLIFNNHYLGEFRELQRSPLAKSLFTIDGVKGK